MIDREVSAGQESNKDSTKVAEDHNALICFCVLIADILRGLYNLVGFKYDSVYLA